LTRSFGAAVHGLCTTRDIHGVFESDGIAIERAATNGPGSGLLHTPISDGLSIALGLAFVAFLMLFRATVQTVIMFATTLVCTANIGSYTSQCTGPGALKTNFLLT
jgi:hypothetical protein